MSKFYHRSKSRDYRRHGDSYDRYRRSSSLEDDYVSRRYHDRGDDRYLKRKEYYSRYKYRYSSRRSYDKYESRYYKRDYDHKRRYYKDIDKKYKWKRSYSSRSRSKSSSSISIYNKNKDDIHTPSRSPSNSRLIISNIDNTFDYNSDEDNISSMNIENDDLTDIGDWNGFPVPKLYEDLNKFYDVPSFLNNNDINSFHIPQNGPKLKRFNDLTIFYDINDRCLNVNNDWRQSIENIIKSQIILLKEHININEIDTEFQSIINYIKSSHQFKLFDL